MATTPPDRASTPRAPAPERPPPPVPRLRTPPPPLETPLSPSPSPSPSPPGEAYHTPTPSLGEASSPREEIGLSSDAGAPAKTPPLSPASLPGGGAPAKTPPLTPVSLPDSTAPAPAKSPLPSPASTPDGRAPARSPLPSPASPHDGRGPAKSPPLTPVRLPEQRRPPPPDSPAGQNGGKEAATAAAVAAAVAQVRPHLRLATGLARTPSSQGSLATKSPSPSPSPTPPSPLTPATPAPAPAVEGNRSAQGTPRRAEAWKPSPPPMPPLSPAAAARFDLAEEAVTSPLRLGSGKARLGEHRQQRAAASVQAAENGADVPADVQAAVAVGERRALSATLRLATAALSLAAFSVIASARTSGWAGDYYARHQQYRYAVAANVIVCAYSIAQAFGEIRRLTATRFIFRSMSSYYFSLFMDQVLAYLLMSASSAAASRHDLWVSRFGNDPFNRKINSAMWLSFIGFLTLAANALISTANLFSMA